MSKILTIPAILQSFRTLKDRSIKIEFETNELTPEQISTLGLYLQTFGVLAFKKDEFKSEQLKLIEESKLDYEDTRKTPSKKLRAVLFVLWKQHNQGYADFEDYYRHQIQIYIDRIKASLE